MHINIITNSFFCIYECLFFLKLLHTFLFIIKSQVQKGGMVLAFNHSIDLLFKRVIVYRM